MTTTLRTDQVLVSPIVTEKSVANAGYTFLVHPKATKQDVKKAVEDFYSVEVVKVNVINLPEKLRTVKGRHVVRKKAPKRKAIVKLKAGTTLEFNAFTA